MSDTKVRGLERETASDHEALPRLLCELLRAKTRSELLSLALGTKSECWKPFAVAEAVLGRKLDWRESLVVSPVVTSALAPLVWEIGLATHAKFSSDSAWRVAVMDLTGLGSLPRGLKAEAAVATTETFKKNALRRFRQAGQELVALLAAANGNRQARTLNMDIVRGVIGGAVEGEHSWDSGGWVANAYRYPARTTRVVATRHGNLVAVRVWSAGACRPHGRAPGNVAKLKLQDADVVMTSRAASLLWKRGAE